MHSARSRTAGLIALAAALATLVFMAFWSYQDWKQYGIASAEFDQVRQILSLNAHLLDLMRDAETGQRGFLLTGREEYLEPYNAAVEEIPRELVILETIVPSGSEQGARFQRLRSMINDQLGELQRTIVLRKAGAVAAALQIVETDRGKRTMDDIRQIAKAIEQAENLRSQSDWNDLVAAAQRLRLITIFGSLLLVGLVVSG